MIDVVLEGIAAEPKAILLPLVAQVAKHKQCKRSAADRCPVEGVSPVKTGRAEPLS